MHFCVFGGQYGSEGKGSVAEWLLHTQRSSHSLIAAGDNGPNAGHTCTRGKTRNMPATAFYSDFVLLGPDSAINPEVLEADIETIIRARGYCPPIFIHENAAIVLPLDGVNERDGDGLEQRISSTVTGGGIAKTRKYYLRQADAVVRAHDSKFADITERTCTRIGILSGVQYLQWVEQNARLDWIFECSQGVLLDTNWGIYPFVTSRSTLPSVALARNALAHFDWKMAGVYRSFPIRTGGPSGPCQGKELTWAEIGVPQEIAAVTKRIRRVFEFKEPEFTYSCKLALPQWLFFTHMDYIKPVCATEEVFISWLSQVGLVNWIRGASNKLDMMHYSVKAGEFNVVHPQDV